MKYDVLYNFISPVTGRVLADTDYVLVGDNQGFATPSPILIDIRLDLINLRERFNYLTNTDFIIGHYNAQAPNAQVLNDMQDGFMYNTDGIVSTINITPANADAKYILQTKSDNLPNAQALDILGGGILKSNSSGVISIASGGATPLFNDYVTPSALIEAVETGVAEAIAAAATAFELEMLPYTPFPNIGAQITAAILAATAVGAAAGLAAATANGKINSLENIKFIITNPESQLPNAQVLSNLGNGFLYNTGGTLSIAGIGSFVISVRGTSGQINSTGGQNPILSLISTGISAGTYFNPIVGVDIYGRIVSISSDETSHTVTLIGDITGSGLVGSNISTTFTKTLNQITNAGNIDIANYALINVKDAVNPKDAVNLETLEGYIADIPASIALTGDVTGIGVVGTPLPTTLELTLDEIKIAQNTVNLNNQRIKNLAQSPVETHDAISAQFLWDLMHDEVGVIWQ